METFLFLFEMLGTIAFAASGAVLGVRKGLDVFGVCILGLTTACGGGMVRDVLLGNTPPAAFQNPTASAVAVVTSLIMFLSGVRHLLMGNQRRYDLFMLLMDSAGLGIITEHFAGAFPTWLAPVQVKILPVTDRALDYAKDLSDALDGQGFRVEVDDRNEKIGKKIREATLEKVPYMIVVGDRDMENKTVSVRTRAGEDLGAMSLEDFTAKLKEVVDSKVLQ